MQVILARHAERVKVSRDQLNLKLTSLRIKKVEIESKLAANPGNCNLRRERQEVDDNIGKTQIELMAEVDMELTNNERTAHNEAWHKHCKSSVSLKMSRGKVYFLLLGQCTKVLLMRWSKIRIGY